MQSGAIFIKENSRRQFNSTWNMTNIKQSLRENEAPWEMASMGTHDSKKQRKKQAYSIGRKMVSYTEVTNVISLPAKVYDLGARDSRMYGQAGSNRNKASYPEKVKQTRIQRHASNLSKIQETSDIQKLYEQGRLYPELGMAASDAKMRPAETTVGRQCPRCRNHNIVALPIADMRDLTRRVRYECLNCGHFFSENV